MPGGRGAMERKHLKNRKGPCRSRRGSDSLIVVRNTSLSTIESTRTSVSPCIHSSGRDSSPTAAQQGWHIRTGIPFLRNSVCQLLPACFRGNELPPSPDKIGILPLSSKLRPDGVFSRPSGRHVGVFRGDMAFEALKDYHEATE